ncbi:hypothetical protein [Maricaulis sp. MIT060901]|uniref:hypothetical protein n=1 Tax=Maricaulis sp. MIT060901 TaxID=3096993 RepID=UPI00399B2DC5
MRTSLAFINCAIGAVILIWIAFHFAYLDGWFGGSEMYRPIGPDFGENTAGLLALSAFHLLTGAYLLRGGHLEPEEA